MPSIRLLHIKTSFVVLEIHGPTKSRWGAIQGTGAERPRLSIESSKGVIDASWTNAGDQLQPWSAEQGGPAFFEETSYRLRAKSLVPGHTPNLIHRDPHLFQEIDTYPDDSMCAGPINFRRQVGLSTLEVRVGHETLRVTIEVFPVKLDYNQDYSALLSDVASAGRGLALEYLRATHRSGAGQDAAHITNLEWLTLLRNEIDILQKAVTYINAHPHRSLSREVENTPIEKIKRIDASVRQAIIRGQGQGSWVDVPSVGRIHSNIPAVRNQNTINTPENRWLRLNLALIRDRLSDIHTSLAMEIDRNKRMNRPISKRVLSEAREIAEFIRTVKSLLTFPVFTNIHLLPPPGFASLALLGSPGYSEAYQAITVLRLGLDVGGTPFDLSVADVHDLYESWCFIQLLRLVTHLTTGHVDLDALLRVDEAGIRVRLRRGEQSSISYAGVSGNHRLLISYNPEYPGLTGNQRPDIVLRFQHAGWPDLVVVFDAKYRLDASEDYRRRFGTAGPPQDAINALHRYRDAIIVDSADRGLHRPVVKGIALFPLSAEEAGEFTSTNLFRALEVLGIGALPFLPTNTTLVETWLNNLLTLPPEALADPGPPFGGLTEKQRRAQAPASTQ